MQVTQRRGAARGFTLLELMVIVAIMGIVAALAAPNLTGVYRRMTLSAEGSRLYSALVSAQGLAATTGRKHCVLMERSNQRWSIRDDSDGDGVCETSDRVVESYPRANEGWPTGIGFGPANGVPAAFATPYDGIPHDAWHKELTDSGATGSSGDATAAIVFDPEGRIVNPSESPISGVVMLNDSTGRAGGNVQAIVYVGATGNLRLFAAAE